MALIYINLSLFKTLEINDAKLFRHSENFKLHKHFNCTIKYN